MANNENLIQEIEKLKKQKKRLVRDLSTQCNKKGKQNGEKVRIEIKPGATTFYATVLVSKETEWMLETKRIMNVKDLNNLRYGQ